MNQLKIALCVAAAALIAAPMLYSALTPPPKSPWGPADSSEIHWRKDYESAVQEVKRSHKPLLVEFSAEWCSPCKQMAETTFREPAVIAAANYYVPVRVDVDKRPDLAQKHDVASLPMSVVVAPTGQAINQAEGYRVAAEYRAFLLQGLSKVPPPGH